MGLETVTLAPISLLTPVAGNQGLDNDLWSGPGEGSIRLCED